MSLQMGGFMSDLGGAGADALADGAESLWDEVLPAEVKALPDDLAKLDELLADPALLAPIARRWERELAPCGRPSIAMESYVRLMVIKHRSGWG